MNTISRLVTLSDVFVDMAINSSSFPILLSAKKILIDELATILTMKSLVSSFR